MMPGRLTRFLGIRFRCFGRDECGVSAVEFALILPMMITLYVCGIEISQAISASRKVTLVSRTIADLVSQEASITDAGMKNIMDAATAVAVPFTATRKTSTGTEEAALTVTISGVKIDANGVAKIAWADTLTGKKQDLPGTTVHKEGDTVTFATCTACTKDQKPLDTPDTTLIWADVSYSWKPIVNFQGVLPSQITLKDQIFMRPRVTTCITRVYASKTISC